MSRQAEEWECTTSVIEISDPYWDPTTGGPSVFHRLASDNKTLLIDWKASQGWELVSLVPAKAIAGLPLQYQKVGDANYPELRWNTYIGFFKRRKN